MSSKEIIDIVSNHDVVIGQCQRRHVYKKCLGFRVVNAFLINDEGRLWIPRRHSDKELFPLHLDASVGGHVLSRESYEDALLRETKEEIGMKLKEGGYQVLGRLTPPEHHTSAFMYVYGINCNQEPEYSKNDFVEAYWLSPNELLNMIEQGDKSKSDLPKIVNFLIHRGVF